MAPVVGTESPLVMHWRSSAKKAWSAGEADSIAAQGPTAAFWGEAHGQRWVLRGLLWVLFDAGRAATHQPPTYRPIAGSQ